MPATWTNMAATRWVAALLAVAGARRMLKFIGRHWSQRSYGSLLGTLCTLLDAAVGIEVHA